MNIPILEAFFSGCKRKASSLQRYLMARSLAFLFLTKLVSLLSEPAQSFLETQDYQVHKKKRFRQEDNPIIGENEAFHLHDSATRMEYKKAYKNSRNLYYKGQPDFDEIMNLIQTFIKRV